MIPRYCEIRIQDGQDAQEENMRPTSTKSIENQFSSNDSLQKQQKAMYDELARNEP